MHGALVYDAILDGGNFFVAEEEGVAVTCQATVTAKMLRDKVERSTTRLRLYHWYFAMSA